MLTGPASFFIHYQPRYLESILKEETPLPHYQIIGRLVVQSDDIIVLFSVMRNTSLITSCQYKKGL